MMSAGRPDARGGTSHCAFACEGLGLDVDVFRDYIEDDLPEVQSGALTDDVLRLCAATCGPQAGNLSQADWPRKVVAKGADSKAQHMGSLLPARIGLRIDHKLPHA